VSFGVDDCDRPDERPAGRRWRPFLTGSVFYRRAPGGIRIGAALIWLAFIVFPLIDAIGKHQPVVRHGLVIGGAALFVVAYVAMVMTWRVGRQTPLTAALFVALLALSTALTLLQGSSWGFLFTYCAACAAIVAPEGTGFYGVVLCSALAGITSALAGADGGTVVSYVASSAGIGLLMLLMSDLRLRNEQLTAARAELAKLAVAQERERFARDLHDLLGHSLSVIALKAELAGRMLAARPADAGPDSGPHLARLDQAATEVRELEQVARTALGEVREAVSGYHQPTLDGELAGARMALSAAGIEADVQRTRVPLDPDVEAVLAWTVREGATNVIRHSGAQHCTLRVIASLTDAGVEVIDDGVGDRAQANGSPVDEAALVLDPGGVDGARGAGEPRGAEHVRAGPVNGQPNGVSKPIDTADRRAAGGHGIAGLAARAHLVNGTLEAGPVNGGGYRLAVTVPISRT
jgi:two-component system sensor histidine kinase DesK